MLHCQRQVTIPFNLAKVRKSADTTVTEPKIPFKAKDLRVE